MPSTIADQNRRPCKERSVKKGVRMTQNRTMSEGRMLKHCTMRYTGRSNFSNTPPELMEITENALNSLPVCRLYKRRVEEHGTELRHRYWHGNPVLKQETAWYYLQIDAIKNARFNEDNRVMLLRDFNRLLRTAKRIEEERT